MKSIQTLTCFALLLWLFTGCGDSADQPASVAGQSSQNQEEPYLVDLSVFPRLPGANKPKFCSMTSLMYTGPGNPIEAYQAIKAKLNAAGWQVKPGETISEKYEQGVGDFEYHGYCLSVSVLRDSGQKNLGFKVRMTHHGKVDWQKLPLPAHLTLDRPSDSRARYGTEQTHEEAIQSITAAFQAAGWIVHEKSTEASAFHQGRQIIQVSVPNQKTNKKGQNIIEIMPLLMAIELPLPPQATNISYFQLDAQLRFDHQGTRNEIIEFYHTELTKLSWNLVAEQVGKSNIQDSLSYSHAEQGFLELRLLTLNGKTLAELKYKSEAQVFMESHQSD